jgi:hypothetical protein
MPVPHMFFFPSANNTVTSPSFVFIPENPGEGFLVTAATTTLEAVLLVGAFLLAGAFTNMGGNVLRNLLLKGFLLVPLLNP